MGKIHIPVTSVDSEASSIDVNSMVLYYEVVNSRSINQAAKLLKIPKATISRKLRRLEQHVGTVLLKRGLRSLSMTSSGEVLYHHCERILTEAQGARAAVAEMQSELTGKLQIATPFGLRSWVNQALAAIALKYPRLEIVVDETHRWVDVSEERYDVAIHLGRIRNERLPVRRFAELHRGVYASPVYLANKSLPQAPCDLLDHSCIALPPQIDDGLWSFRMPNASHEVTIRPRACVSDIVLAQELALAGVGFAILPHAICSRDVADGKLVRVLPTWRIPPLIPAATYLERRYMPLRIRDFLDMLAVQLKQDPPAERNPLR
jgi:DNA-binding transcriptional LysR family regulator